MGVQWYLPAMDHAAARKHDKLIAAVAVSVGLHVLVGFLGWALAGSTAGAGSGLGTAVDTPDGPEMVISLREPTSTRPRISPVVVAAPVEAPAALPAAVVRPETAAANDGALVQTVSSQPAVGSLPKMGGAKGLHGRLPPGKSVVYVLDRSSSMGTGGVLAVATGTIKASLAALPPDVRFQIVAYNGSGIRFATTLVPANPENVRRAGVWLDQLRAEGASNHVAGIKEGLWLQPDVVYLLTDADDLADREVREIGRLLRVPMHLALVGDGRLTAETPLARLARQHGGTVQVVGR
jgi:hypothetical protein